MGESSAYGSSGHNNVGGIAPFRWWPFAIAAAYLLSVLGVGLAVYPSVPDPMPVHFNGAFEADAWGPKSLMGFLLPVFIGFGVVLLMAALAAAMPTISRLGEKDREHESLVQLSPRPPINATSATLTRRLLERMGLSVAFLIGTVALFTWFGAPAWANPWAAIVLIGGFFAVVTLSTIPIIRNERRAYGGA